MTEAPLNEAVVLSILQQVLDPELGLSIVDLGLIYDVRIEGSQVRVAMTLTSAGCPMGESIRQGAELTLLNHPAVTKAQVELVFDPPWHPGLVLDAGRAARPEFF
jgi:metal-sulfur cluster biosynthetic enzyme